MKDLSSYDNLIFDLGGVILNLDFKLTIQSFKEHIEHFDEQAFLGKEHQSDMFSLYEVDKIETEIFRNQFRERYQTHISNNVFDACWNAMILDFPIERINLLKKLRSRGQKIFLLSNINHLHELAVEESFRRLGLEFDFFDLFDRAYYSHHIGLRKPSPEVFHHVLNDNKLVHDRTCFIDDSLQHILTARSLGIDSIHLAKPLAIESHPFFSNL